MEARASRFPHRYRTTAAHCRHEAEASQAGTVVRVVPVALAVRTAAVGVPARPAVATVAVAAEAREAVVTGAEGEAPADPADPVDPVVLAAAVPPLVVAAITKEAMKSSRR
jgi:hypothetical protein